MKQILVACLYRCWSIKSDPQVLKIYRSSGKVSQVHIFIGLVVKICFLLLVTAEDFTSILGWNFQLLQFWRPTSRASDGSGVDNFSILVLYASNFC
jgi:hypothetical protein